MWRFLKDQKRHSLLQGAQMPRCLYSAKPLEARRLMIPGGQPVRRNTVGLSAASCYQGLFKVCPVTEKRRVAVENTSAETSWIFNYNEDKGPLSCVHDPEHDLDFGRIARKRQAVVVQSHSTILDQEEEEQNALSLLLFMNNLEIQNRPALSSCRKASTRNQRERKKKKEWPPWSPNLDSNPGGGFLLI